MVTRTNKPIRQNATNLSVTERITKKDLGKSKPKLRLPSEAQNSIYDDLKEMESYDIFISYRTTHGDWVETLAQNLKDQGYSIFLDRWALIPGQNFPANIHRALKDARCAILVATPDASDSGWVQQELDLMLSLKNQASGFFFIPVVMGQFPDLPFLETVQAVDFGDSSPKSYRCAFHRLICGLKQEPPGPDKEFAGDLKFPRAEPAKKRQLAQSEHDFLEQVFDRLRSGQPLIILAQADTDTQVYGRALRERAEELFGPENVLQIFPPNSTRADSNAYFGRLARQCHLDPTKVSESWLWAQALEEKLENGQKLFLLVTGYENGVDSAREELAGELRQLNERFPGFRPLILGGERLAALKYAQGNMSLLNIAEDIMIPEPDSVNLKTIYGEVYPDLQQTNQQLEAVLTFTGGHPRLLSYCLQQGADCAQSCEQILRDSPLPAQLFTRFRDEHNRLPLINLLKQPSLGRFDPWPNEELLRKLYWNNLITRQEQYFSWRCEFIRKMGLEIISC